MKAICLASAMTVVLLLLVTLAFRLDPCKHRVRRITALHLACSAALIGLWFATPDDLAFLHRSLLAEPPWFDLLLTLFFFSAAFFGGVLQLYNLADRGFSLRILIDALEDPAGTIDVDRLAAGYGGGQGIRWMYDKRVRGLLEGEIVRRVDDSLALSPTGILLGDAFIHIRRFLNLGLP
jgi:hypothetical protein